MHEISALARRAFGIGTAGIIAIVLLGTAAPAATDPPAETPARFAMSPAEGGGFVRLDTHTGQMSMCNRRDGAWLCTDMPDQGRGLAEEVERLRAQNKDLKADIRRMEDIMVGDGRGSGAGGSGAGSTPGRPDAERRAEGPAGKFGLPSEQDVDQALSYMERMFRKFRDKLKEFESDGRGTPL